jgi:hypothetical protein
MAAGGKIQMKHKLKVLLLALAFAANGFAQTNWPPTPPQDQGLPYTRTMQKVAVAKIKDAVAVFADSRYAWVHGFKVRLDNVNWRDEAVLRDGKVYVPAAFAGVLDLAAVKPAPAPDYLADRWVYSLDLPKTKAPTVQIDGKDYVALADEAQKRGLKIYQNERGLLLIGKSEIAFSESESNLLDTIITLFDTPEKFADPDIATRWIPALKRQGAWTNYVKVTPEQMKIFNGPETKWPTAPKSEYDYSGFNKKLLGSKVPPPGVYPRVLFSPEDVPMLAARVKKSNIGQKSLIEMRFLFEQSFWNTNTSDGQFFLKLANNDLAGLQWPDDVPPTQIATINTAQQFKGQKQGIYNSHVAYDPECLTTMALYCLLTGDDVHGRQAATAIANYYKLREPLIDQWNVASDSEFGDEKNDGNGATTAWRGMHGLVAHMNLGLALDFGGKWMTLEQIDTMRRVIAKATYGRRAYGEDSTVRFRDVNWVGWDLPQFLALTAIEGLEGFDREAWETGRDTVRAFCDWGIDDSGVVYESNGKTPGSFQFITLSMVATARRGENLFGHPHLRKLLEAQTQMTSPNGRVTVNSGTQYTPYSRQVLSPGLVDELKSFYPRNRVADYLLTKITRSPADAADEYNRGWAIENFDAAKYREQVKKVQRLRLPSPTYPGFVPGVLYDSDFVVTTRADLDLPLDFNAPVHGVFSSYSDRSTNATWINMMVRPNHYLGAGHHHADAGMFHFSALGVDWFTQSPFTQVYDGHLFNLVQVDGESEAVSLPDDKILGWNAAAKYLGATENKFGAAASADLTYAYSYRWLGQPPQEWSEHLKHLGWEVEPSPRILDIFAGTARYKMRPWWSTYNFCNWIPTSRAPFNPMQRVFRTIGLVRGEKPYGFVVDDLKKDNAAHLYQWFGMLNGGVWQADVPNLPPNQIALAYRAGDPKLDSNAVKPAITPQPGEPLLLVCALGMADSGDAALPLFQIATCEGPKDKTGKPQYYDRLAINRRAAAVNFRVLLIPFRAGEPLPQISVDAANGIATVTCAGQRDEIKFRSDADQRTHVSVTRDGKEIVSSK